MPLAPCRICQQNHDWPEEEASRPDHACDALDRVCVTCAVEDGDTWARLSALQRDAAMAAFLRQST